ncbi:MAG: helix-turn-helix domain-containing protein, partial [Plesiomonas sp.]
DFQPNMASYPHNSVVEQTKQVISSVSGDNEQDILERAALNEIFNEAVNITSDEVATTELTAESENHQTSLPPEGMNLKEMLSDLEIGLIRQALEAQCGVVARAADMLGMRRTTLVEKMRKYGLNKESSVA